MYTGGPSDVVSGGISSVGGGPETLEIRQREEVERPVEGRRPERAVWNSPALAESRQHTPVVVPLTPEKEDRAGVLENAAQFWDAAPAVEV